MVIRRVYQDWVQELSYLNRRGSRAKRGVRAYSPAWSEQPKQELSVRRGMRERGHNSG